MDKLIIFGLIGVILVGGLIAQELTISLKDVSYTDLSKETQTNNQIITYNCGKTIKNVTLNEPDGKIDENDLLSAIQCKETVTNIKYGTLVWKENKYGDKSFNETELKMKECLGDGNVWIENKCQLYVAPIEEEPKEPPFEEPIRDDSIDGAYDSGSG